VYRTPAPLPVEEVEASLRPFGRSRMLPRAAYVDDDVLEWERRHFFDGGWVCAGRLDALAEPKSQTAVRVGSTGVLLTRDAEGVLHAFANICRHRGHELLARGATAVRGVIQCPYHAWTYELDGSLRLAPHLGDVPNFDRAEMGLQAVGHAVWGGWVFVNVNGRAGPFVDHLGDFGMLTADWECERLVVAASHEYELRANWKVAIENYHECYHCGLIHPELCRVSPSDSGENFRDGTGAWVGGRMDLVDGAETMSLDGRSAGVTLRGLSDSERRQVLYLNVFPNLLVSLHPDYVMTHRIEPLTPSTSHVECQWLFAPEATEQAGFDPRYAVDFWDLVNRQDWAAVESVQRGLDSPMFVPGLLGTSEDAVYQFVTMVAGGYLGRELVRGSVADRV
jgi:phenylpropionate dioxygenase-like ring-hydroxylating dioxygenase large terminal subunit